MDTPARPRVLLLENIHVSAKEAFEAEGFAVSVEKSAFKEGDLKEQLKGVAVLGIRSKTQLPAAVLAAAPDLLAVGCFCIGTNQVDLLSANGRGVPVFNAPFSNTRSVAELILAEIVILTRQVGDRSRELHQGQWRKVSDGSHEVRGKTLGIVGYGHIGSQIGVLAEAFGMRVLFYDTLTKLPMGNNVQVGSLEALLKEADFVTLHVPATAQTHNMMTEAQLSLMKPTASLLNASRGTVVDIDALAVALKARKLAGAAVDVFPEEPESNSDGFVSPLQGVRNVLLTPHIGGSTEEAQASIGKEVSTSLIKFIQSGATTAAVNFPQVEQPIPKGTHRVVNVHRNVPGVLRDINRIVSDLNANIHSQILSTDPQIGYLLMDLDQDVSAAVTERMRALKTDIRTRVLR